MYILSNFLNDKNDSLNIVKSFTISNNLSQNNLFVQEEYMINGSSNYSYINQTVFVSKIVMIDEKILITIHPVATIDFNTKLVSIRKYGSNLISFDNGNNWFTTDCNEHNICNKDNILKKHDVCVKLNMVMNESDVVTRDFICNRIYIEKNGVYLSDRVIAEKREIPEWCKLNKV